MPSLLWVVLASLATALLCYSQAVAYFGNESFHLLASQLILAGKKPYVDFFYQHPPLFAYINAAWMRIFGENWRSAHVLSALLTSGCIVTVAGYVHARLGDSSLRTPITATVAALIGLNFYVVCYGNVALPFAICLLLTVAAFRLTTVAVRKNETMIPFIAGLAAGSAATSSLLTAPVLVILFVWLGINVQRSKRVRHCLSFAAGAMLPFLPLVLLGLKAPGPVFFDLVTYHLFYRAGSDGSMIRWNLREILDWFVSIQGFVLVGLALVGLAFVVKRRELSSERRQESYLCAVLLVVLMVYFATPRPTFSFYFVLVTPFVAILAANGLEFLGKSGWFRGRRVWVISVMVGVYFTGLGWQVNKMRREIFHADHRTIEEIASLINQVTPADGWVFAFEQVYFEAQRMPPPGMENGFNPYSRGDEWLAANRFATVCVMANDPRVKSLNLFRRYANNKTLVSPNFTVYLFWNRLISPSEPP